MNVSADPPPAPHNSAWGTPEASSRVQGEAPALVSPPLRLLHVIAAILDEYATTRDASDPNAVQHTGK